MKMDCSNIILVTRSTW